MQIRARHYTDEEIKQKLKQRAEHTVKPGTITDRNLDKIAKAGSQEGDIRLGFRILLTAGMLAEKADEQTIEAADITLAIKKEREVKDLRQLDAIEDQLLYLKRRTKEATLNSKRTAPHALEVFLGRKKERKRKEGDDVLIESDFLLSYRASEGFATMVVKSNRQFCSLATLVRSTSHLPRLRRSANFSSTLRTLWHAHSSLRHCMMLKI
ncbi:MAG TPA: hypothetical protein VK487_09435 [Candidatus Bathyarchaeia archaeon]|nr:hypothetical protein [Candidatus Bathyarchaeia archaeon]